MSRETSSLLSIVVIGRNEGERLRSCLASVGKMQRGDWRTEVIYVDSGSTDDSCALAAGMGAHVIALQPQRPTAALGRNAGWRAASGELVLFLDGDTVLDESFFIDALTAFQEPSVAVVWGHRREMHPEKTIYNRVLDLDWIYAPGLTAFCGGDALFRREVLLETGGFDESLIAGEEPELCRRVLASGSSILHIDRAMTGHDLAMSNFAQYWRRATRAGHAYAEIAQRFADAAEPFWTEEVRRNRRRAIMLSSIFLAGMVGSIALKSAWPSVTTVALFAVLAARTAWKARWKSTDTLTLLAYGVHSHLQQVPIYWGQLGFAANRRRGTQARLLEYKQR